MPAQSIAVLYSQSLFAAGVENRLRSHQGFQVERVDASHPDAFSKLKEFCPQIVILDLADPERGVVTLMSTILADMPGVQIIGLDLGSRELRIYRQERRTPATSGHLLEAISSLLPRSKGTKLRVDG